MKHSAFHVVQVGKWYSSITGEIVCHKAVLRPEKSYKGFQRAQTEDNVLIHDSLIE